MKMKKVVLCSFMCIMFSACQHAVKSNRELFDEQYEKKLKSCVRVMIDNADVDSLQAESICSCLLNNLFLIDSNFVKMPDDSLTLLLDINREKLEKMCNKGTE
ncbi:MULTISPECIES: hypothetical protein [Bacteroides]|uniref:Lipoprotein n=2 Tax=Bacteroides TaxID=816 RepID=A0A9X2NQC9_9BACE|nr:MULTISPECIES: hypothetical protein [Bacteroides]MCR6504246.1 hypothetical protein [Bacteroides muris (ex Fokt et al. 2023)]NVK92878.1 hypothetical protein [Bacteroides sp. L10-4]